MRHPAGAREGAGMACYACGRTRRSFWSLRLSWDLWKIKQWRRYPGHSIQSVEGTKLMGFFQRVFRIDRSVLGFPALWAPSAAGQIVRQRPIQRGSVSARLPAGNDFGKFGHKVIRAPSLGVFL